MGVKVGQKVLEKATKCEPTFLYLKDKIPRYEAIRKMFLTLQIKKMGIYPGNWAVFIWVFVL